MDDRKKKKILMMLSKENANRSITISGRKIGGEPAKSVLEEYRRSEAAKPQKRGFRIPYVAVLIVVIIVMALFVRAFMM